MADEKDAVTDQTVDILNTQVSTLDTMLENFEAYLRHKGDFEVPDGLHPGDEVAAKVSPTENLWILARILKFHGNTNTYEVADADDANRQYTLPDVQIEQIPDEEEEKGEGRKFQKGERVLAMYPDTTSFYPCFITQVPKKTAVQQIYLVQFDDDADETGVEPHRPCPARYVLVMPNT